MIKILIVDDELDVKSLFVQKFRKKLHSKEWSFIFCQNGREALKVLNQHNDIDLVLSDINMPEMDGLTLLSEIRNNKIDVKTVIISAYGDMKNIRTAMNRGAFDFITKPMDFEDVSATIDKTIKHIEVLKKAVKYQHQLISIHKELEIAKTVQESILPVSSSLTPQCDIFAKIIPAREVGGDFYDFFLIDKTHLSFIIADVSGKGISSAIFAVVNQTLLKSVGSKILSPKVCVESVNHSCSINNKNCMFVTIFYSIFNLVTGQLTYINAGHTIPYKISGNGKVEGLPVTNDIPLGIKKNFNFQEKSIQLKPGDTICLYTDGITESKNKKQEMFGENRLRQILSKSVGQSIEKTGKKILKSVSDFSENTLQSDDITYLLFTYNG